MFVCMTNKRSISPNTKQKNSATRNWHFRLASLGLNNNNTPWCAYSTQRALISHLLCVCVRQSCTHTRTRTQMHTHRCEMARSQLRNKQNTTTHDLNGFLFSRIMRVCCCGCLFSITIYRSVRNRLANERQQQYTLPHNVANRLAKTVSSVPHNSRNVVENSQWPSKQLFFFYARAYSYDCVG